MLKRLTFILIVLYCCNVFSQSVITEANKYLNNQPFKELLFISIHNQRLYHIKKDSIVKDYIISSSAYGTGNKAGSNKTPLGLHKIKEEHGEKTPINGIMIGRIFYGNIAKIYTDKTQSKTGSGNFGNHFNGTGQTSPPGFFWRRSSKTHYRKR